MDCNTEYYLQLLKSVITNSHLSEPSVDVDWHSVYLFAVSQSQFSVFCDGVNKVSNRPEQSVMDKLNTTYLSHIKRDTVRDKAMNDIIERFESEQIKCMGLKGYVIRNLYPNTVYRYLSDFDLLCAPENFSKACEVLTQMGYKLIKDDPHHTIFVSKNLAVELHKKLFINKYGDYFSDGFNKAVLCEGYNYVYTLEPDKLYIYFIAHTASHFAQAGIGLRSITDAFLLYSNYRDFINSEYTKGELEKLGLYTFSKEFINLALYIFTDSKKSEITENLLDFVCESNTSGNSVKESQLKAVKAGGKTAGVVKNVFPPYKYLLYRYEWLKNKPYFVPLAWVKRFFDILLNSKRRKKVSESLTLGNDEIKKTENLLKSLGLDI